MRRLAALSLLALTNVALADMDSIPTQETAFVDTIQSIPQARIVELLGDPAYVYTIRDKDGLPVGAIWHYRYVTTTDDGEYYKTTELDFIGDKVTTVVFINTDTADDALASASPTSCEGDATISC